MAKNRAESTASPCAPSGRSGRLEPGGPACCGLFPAYLADALARLCLPLGLREAPGAAKQLPLPRPRDFAVPAKKKIKKTPNFPARPVDSASILHLHRAGQRNPAACAFFGMKINEKKHEETVKKGPTCARAAAAQSPPR